MDSSQKYLCLHILGFKKSGVTIAEYREYMVNVHSPLVGGLVAKYGIIHWSMSHPDEQSPDLFDKIRDGLFANLAPFDVVVTIVMPDIDTWLRFRADPFFKKDVGPDHDKFADTRRSQMMLGWYTPLLEDGKLLIDPPVM
ncbi:Uncharacterized protein TCAP_07123 [Tolypocladium capitatum]|uniref:EthD domain-containing protein n=1 Tax=Tolypocladium capitatum TaxID=45235 RepID=A0A2K3Q4R1_9HYPO|nr:Uncharacterized protein TCAP_07123 [Tolypocladium capitatum]